MQLMTCKHLNVLKNTLNKINVKQPKKKLIIGTVRNNLIISKTVRNNLIAIQFLQRNQPNVYYQNFKANIVAK